MHIIKGLESPIRLDKYIKQLLPSITQGIIEKSLRSGNIKLNDCKIKSNQRINNGDSIFILDSLFKLYKDNKERVKKEIYIPDDKLLNRVKDSIIYEDNNLVVLNKPSGISCQAGSRIVHSIDRLINSIYEQEIRIVHRLDKETTGVLLLAKNLKYAQLLTKLFKEHKIQKTYHAVSNFVELNGSKGRRLQRILLDEKYLFLKAPLRSIKISGEEAIVVDFENGEDAISEVILLCEHDGLYHFKIKPLTGRKHQIRAHLKYLGFPIIGDSKYNEIKSNDRMHLHASSLAIDDLGLYFNAEPNKDRIFFRSIKD